MFVSLKDFDFCAQDSLLSIEKRNAASVDTIVRGGMEANQALQARFSSSVSTTLEDAGIANTDINSSIDHSLQLDHKACGILNSMITPCCAELTEWKGGHYNRIVEITENAGKCLLNEYMGLIVKCLVLRFPLRVLLQNSKVKLALLATCALFNLKSSSYRRYAIEEIEAATSFFAESLRIGEGGYGPVYRCLPDHTPVAVKVLHPDAQQGSSQFQREANKKIEDAKLARDFQTTLKEFQKVQLASERESTYTPAASASSLPTRSTMYISKMN
ncbi:kinase superfamily protein, putative [Medicago truncatula]|uniref:RING-type E3 ubiquitin transferase n=1 Tax=Medicago truncatula TaxID=3880 RepID=A0A072TFE7_MEDTR|nr:kinase superfamily protein, putative [Medicago truncatula]